LDLKKAAAAVSLLDGAWTVVAGGYWRQVFGATSRMHSSDNIILLALGIVLVIDSLVCFRGVLEAFYASVVLAIVAALGILSWGVSLGSAGFAVTALLAVLTVILDALGARRKTSFTEEDHPLNLPVFG
jgi:hypothetical protein